jgi:hypothetical protein
VEQLRQALTTDLILLHSLRPALDQQEAMLAYNDDPVEDLFDDSEDEQEDPNAGADAGLLNSEPQADDLTPPEQKSLHLPSSLVNEHPLREAELSLRIKQASRYLAAIREAVAEKSFQYSHVIRSAASNVIRTRFRGTVTRISERISSMSKVYCRARSAMRRLGADEQLMHTFRELKREDVKASTAIIDPNIPGSSTLHLSWIWETGSRNAGSTPEAMRECACQCQFRVSYMIFF